MSNIITSDLYSKIVDLLQQSRQKVVNTINQTMVNSYYEIGRMIVEHEQHGKQRAEYGKFILKDLSNKLSSQFGKGFSLRNLEQMRQFYLCYSITQTVSAESKKPEFYLSWSHYLKLMRIRNENERSFYEIECKANNWSLKELQRQFDSALYERLALSRSKSDVEKLSKLGHMVEKPIDLLKDPYILEFLDLPEKHAYSESALEQALIDKLEHFLLELGKGFTYVGRQVRISFDEKHFKVDLVLFNRLLRCFCLIDLKIGELTHQDLGQMQMYVNYYDRFVRLPEENKTIGIIICKDKSNALVEITLPEDNDSIFAGRYQTIIPDKQTLIKLMNSENNK
ncbi:MAG: YhcG family protein [Neisseriaceae bacterium]